MADARPAAARFLQAVPLLMCQLRTELAEADAGLTVAQFRCLGMVQRDPAIGLGELADATGVSAPAMSKLVDGLVAAGLLERRPGRGDRRRVELSVTRAGARRLEAVRGRLQERLAQGLSGLPAAELAALERALARLADALRPAAAPEVAP